MNPGLFPNKFQGGPLTGLAALKGYRQSMKVFQHRLLACIVAALAVFAAGEEVQGPPQALAAATSRDRVFILELKCADGFVAGMDIADPAALCLEIEEKIAAAMNGAGFGTFLARDLADDAAHGGQAQLEQPAKQPPEKTAEETAEKPQDEPNPDVPAAPAPVPPNSVKQPGTTPPSAKKDESDLPLVRAQSPKDAPGTADKALETSVAPENGESGPAGWLGELLPPVAPAEKTRPAPDKPAANNGQGKDKEDSAHSRPDPEAAPKESDSKADEKPADGEPLELTPDAADKDAPSPAASVHVIGEILSLTAGAVEAKMIAGRERKSADVEIVASFDIRDEGGAGLFSGNLKGLARKDTPPTSDALESASGKKELAALAGQRLADALVAKLRGAAPSPQTQPQPANDRERYQDSPGKRLKPRTKK